MLHRITNYDAHLEGKPPAPTLLVPHKRSVFSHPVATVPPPPSPARSTERISLIVRTRSVQMIPDSPCHSTPSAALTLTRVSEFELHWDRRKRTMDHCCYTGRANMCPESPLLFKCTTTSGLRRQSAVGFGVDFPHDPQANATAALLDVGAL